MKQKHNAKTDVSPVRSSAAEYLTFVAASGQGGVEAIYADENIWLTQRMMGLLYDVETHTVNYHLKKVFADSELKADSVIRNFRITAADGKNYHTQHYSLPAIIAVGYKVNSETLFCHSAKQAALGHSRANRRRGGLPPGKCRQATHGVDHMERRADGQGPKI